MAHEQAEEALRLSEERYRSLFTGMTEGFALHEIICDEQGVRNADFPTMFWDVSLKPAGNSTNSAFTLIYVDRLTGRAHVAAGYLDLGPPS